MFPKKQKEKGEAAFRSTSKIAFYHHALKYELPLRLALFYVMYKRWVDII